MAGDTRSPRVRRPRYARPLVVGGLLVVVFELLLVGTYVFVRDARITNALPLVYPFVWIDVSLVAVLTATPSPESRRQRLLGVGVAMGYFLVLGYFGGLYGIGSGGIPLHLDWQLPPGYGPALIYDGQLLRVMLQPYKVVGYFALAYLVYATVLDAAGAAASGVVGLFSCVSCAWPVLGTVTTSLFGSSSAVAAVALSHSYGLGTLVFLSAVGLLYYRPLR